MPQQGLGTKGPITRSSSMRLGDSLPFGFYLLETGAQRRIYVNPGTVNDVMATLGGVALDASSAPYILTTASTSYYVWVKCVATFGVSGAADTYVVTIEYNTTGTHPGGTSISGTGFTSLRYLGRVIAPASIEDFYFSVVTRVISSNQGCESLGATNYWWNV